MRVNISCFGKSVCVWMVYGSCGRHGMDQLTHIVFPTSPTQHKQEQLWQVPKGGCH